MAVSQGLKKRIQLPLTPVQWRAIKAAARALGVSVCQFIRDAAARKAGVNRKARGA